MGGITVLSGWEEIDGSCYNFYNWGWDGWCNGWYLDGVFKPAQKSLTEPYPIEIGREYIEIEYATILK